VVRTDYDEELGFDLDVMEPEDFGASYRPVLDDAEWVREVVREAIIVESTKYAQGDHGTRHQMYGAIADRVAAQLTPDRMRTRIAELEAVIREHIAAHESPARSSNRGETSVWLARTADAERALRVAVGATVPFPHAEATGVLARAERLEAEVARMRSVVEAADAWLDDPCKGLGSHREHGLADAVKTYRAGRAPSTAPTGHARSVPYGPGTVEDSSPVGLEFNIAIPAILTSAGGEAPTDIRVRLAAGRPSPDILASVVAQLLPHIKDPVMIIGCARTLCAELDLDALIRVRDTVEGIMAARSHLD
jgi:hypothetical protein